MSLEAAALVALALIGLLFAVAAFVEARADVHGTRPRLRHGAYTLALAVYCSSWTIYGAVGSAVRDGWAYLPIYVAPMVMLALAPRFLAALARGVAEEQAATVSDFIAARFGHDVVVARLVTVIALMGTVPYMALQLRSIGSVLSIATGSGAVVPAIAVPVMLVSAGLLAIFGMMFGARRYELASRSEGLVYAMGLDSLIKLVAMLLVAATAVVMLIHAPPAQVAAGFAGLAGRFQPQHLTADVAVICLISALAVIALPRQFYMAVVEARAADDLVRARWGFAAYLAIMAAAVLPIALAGLTLLGPKASADYFVLLLPMAGGHPVVAAVALLGGLSAASAMVIADATALATMVSNDLVFPTLIRGRKRGAGLAAGELGRRMLVVRRLSIVAVVALALSWALLVNPRESLASLGLVAFAAMAQFTPHLLLAVRGRDNDPHAARASLAAGLGLWLYTLALPPILPLGWRAALAAGPLDPLHLLGLGHATPLVHGVGWSLGVNLAVYGFMRLRKLERPALPSIMRGQRQVSDLVELRDLTASFVGRERADAEFGAVKRGAAIDRRAALRARGLIAGVVGASSARALVASALAGGRMSIGEVTRLLDERGQNLGFSRSLLAATFENIDAGISVVDSQLNLVAWNARYEALFGYPPGMLRVGVPVADLIRFNAQRGDFGPGDVELHVAKRLGHLRRGQEHGFERHRNDGRVIKTVGGPMPKGGYVTSYTDMTEEARIRAELERTAAELESRVLERTEALSAANRQLASASRDKTRFLAAASHDLLQPLHAARLFTAALARETSVAAQGLVGRVDSAIVAAEDLLRALLDISKLDAGGVQPAPELLDLAPFLGGLVEGFRPLAEGNGLGLRLGPARGFVRTDAGLLRSIMQNFITNALRYTQRGGVMVGVRRRGDRWRIDVVDSGVGIEPRQIDAIFGEFTRLGTVEAEGLGLGLALVERIARLLGAEIAVRSVPGRGSRFSLSLPVEHGVAVPAAPVAPVAPGHATGGLTVLVVDDEPRIVEASLALLASLGHRGIGAGSAAEAMRHVAAADAVLADYQLGHSEDGLSLIAQMRELRPDLPAVLITAEPSAAPNTTPNTTIAARARAMGIQVLAKPASPALIETFLSAVARAG